MHQRPIDIEAEVVDRLPPTPTIGPHESAAYASFDPQCGAWLLPRIGGAERGRIPPSRSCHAGEAAAQDCARRWKREGRFVRIARPPRACDFNDLLLGRVPPIEEGAALSQCGLRAGVCSEVHPR